MDEVSWKLVLLLVLYVLVLVRTSAITFGVRELKSATVSDVAVSDCCAISPF